MTILMNYQTLVERDSKSILCYWKYLILTLLLVISISALITSFSFEGLVECFDNCFLIDSVAFKPVKYNDSHPKIQPFMHFFRREIEENTTDNIKFLVFHKINNNGQIIDPVEFEFFKSNDIDAFNTRWEEKSKCEYMSLMPVLEAFVALFWLTLFFMCGRGGYARKLTFNPHAWEIVIPAILFFLMMAVFSVMYLFSVQMRLDTFCDIFQSHLVNTSVSCGVVMNRFSVVHTDISPAVNYRLTMFFSWLKAICWLTAVSGMFVRCLTGIDFQPVTVTVKTVDHQSDSGSGSSDDFFSSNSDFVSAKMIKPQIMDFEAALKPR